MCFSVQSCRVVRCPPAPTGGRQEAEEGRKDAIGRPQNNQGHRAARREKQKRKQTNTSPEGSRKEMWLCFYKRKKNSLRVYFALPIKAYQNGRDHLFLPHITASVCSSHPIRWHVPPEKPSLLYPHTFVLKKRKTRAAARYNESGLL